MSVVDETAQKRPRSSPTLLTPTNQSKRRPVFARSSQLTSRRRIFSSPATILTATFHAKPVHMPPMASATSIQRVIEHSYS